MLRVYYDVGGWNPENFLDTSTFLYTFGLGRLNVGRLDVLSPVIVTLQHIPKGFIICIIFNITLDRTSSFCLIPCFNNKWPWLYVNSNSKHMIHKLAFYSKRLVSDWCIRMMLSKCMKHRHSFRIFTRCTFVRSKPHVSPIFDSTQCTQ